MTGLTYLRGVTTLELDEGRCIGCGVCVLVCPHAVFVMNDVGARVSDRDACMECGACALNCESDAISVSAGVGCAAAVINSALGRTEASCCVSED